MFKHPGKILMPIAVLSVITMSSVGCGESTTDGEEINEVNPELINGHTTTNIGGKIFSIPSPFQTAELIKESGAPYDPELLNSPDNISNYSTKFHRALNLGIYGADLGYTTMYDNTNEALTFLTAVEKLSNELDVGGAFSKEIIDRFSNNMGNKDSMLVIVSDAYRTGDEYLKNNDRHKEAGLILTGGWIEALYFATEVVGTSKNPKIVNRIGEQKTTLKNLIELLSNYINEESYSNLIRDLEDLYLEFNSVESSYSYVKPETDAEKQMTVIKCSSDVKISDEVLKNISERVKMLRNKIVDSSL
jgi:hypothetical protein